MTPLDNLAGIAIKYGVTIRDIKRANGGMITDATLFARGTLRIPRHALAEGAPLPGGGGVTGDAARSSASAAEAASMTPALQKLRGYYGLSPGDEGYVHAGEGGRGGGDGDGGGSETGGSAGGRGSHSRPSSSTSSGRAGSEHINNVSEVQMAFMGGEQSVKKVTRGGGGGSNSGSDRSGSASGGSGGGGGGGQGQGRYGTQYAGSGAMSANAFQGRDRPLMSPPKVMTASGAAVAPGASTGGGASGMMGGGGTATAAAKGFFARLKAMANAPAMATPASAPTLGAVASGVVDGGGGGGRGGGPPGRSKGIIIGGGGSSLPAGQKGKGD